MMSHENDTQEHERECGSMMLTSMPAQDHLNDPGPSPPVTQNSDERSHAWYFSTVPAQEIVPIVDDRFQSSIRGIYVIGDVTGLPLVKVAANQGVQVIAAMQKAGEFSRSGDLEGLDLVIIGGGPAGVSAAAEAEKLGIRYVVLERNRLASTIRSFPPGKMVYAEPQFIANASQLDVDEDVDKDEFLSRISALVQQKQLKIQEGVDVKHVRQAGDHEFEIVTAAGKTIPARTVLVAIGRQGQPRLLECPGADEAHKVTYRLHSPADYQGKNLLIVGGGNSAIEAALLLKDHNHVTMSYRGDSLFRAKEENRTLIAEAEQAGSVTILYQSTVKRIDDAEVEIDVAGRRRRIANDHVIVQIGTLPPIPFLMDMGLELDGIWTVRRLLMSMVGLVVGFLIYFQAKHFVLLPEKSGTGKLLVPMAGILQPFWSSTLRNALTDAILPLLCSALLAMWLINRQQVLRGRQRLIPIPAIGSWLGVCSAVYAATLMMPNVLTLNPAEAGPGPYYVPGFAWLFRVISPYFANVYGFYYLAYFVAITGFGLYWAKKSGHPLIWRRNLTFIATQWTLWWGIPTFLAMTLGRNAWTPVASKLINAWPLNMTAFRVDPVVNNGDPEWWSVVAVAGVVWAVFLTFVIIPLFTIRWGKIYCSYICSCGALAETVGNGYRHRGPKGDAPRRLERFGFVFIALASVATVADLLGIAGPFEWYNVYVGTALAGAVAIGLYPFLGQRIWCRMWCPLAFWMNFWGRWSKFKISAVKGKCIDCNVCNQYCQMGIDIKSRAMQGLPVTLDTTPCVGCAECVVRCPMNVLHLGELPASPSKPSLLPILSDLSVGTRP
ncbi:MAG: NAD(P)-binding domain-containing protein [Planctomyces sp.]|nr:NAD(P)-binding domain-containing protein [Planctomyces sp.]